jgi:uncharacterized protein YecT (DUF1311 family)
MKTISFAITCMLAAVTASAAEKGPDVRLVTSPNGEFAVGWNRSEHTLWTASTKDGTDLGDVKLSHLADVDEGSEFTPVPFISPDSNWIFVPSRHADFAPTLELEAFLLHRTPSKTPQFEFVLALEFGQRAWEFLAKELKLKTGEVNADAHRVFSVHFVDWSEDSSWLLICVGSAVVSSKADWLESYPVPFFVCYFNTRKGEFELTERLRSADNTPRSEAGQEPKLSAVVTSAESIGKEGPQDSPEDAFKEADAHLNDIYGKLVAKLTPAQKQVLREEERAWIRSRDDQSKIWVLQTWSTDYGASARTLERNALATEARAAELEKRLEKP